MYSILRRRLLALIGATAAGAALVGLVIADQDAGSTQQAMLAARSMELYGLEQPLTAASTTSADPDQAKADPTLLVTPAGGLKARVVTANGPASIDMMALWPNDREPAYVLTCNEQSPEEAGFVRINIATGAVETIVTGTRSCDGVRRTPWGSVLFSEEAGGGAQGGRVYELINPLETSGVKLDRATGVFSGGTGAANLTARPALGRNSFEGFALFPNGVVYYGDENRPSNGKPGGAFFKFIPSKPWDLNAAPITSLDQSPFTEGAIYGLRLGKRTSGGETDNGHRTSYGLGQWIPIPAGADVDLRAQTAALNLTGYYRPEDIDIDGRALADGRVRFCGTNTGNEVDDRYYGEIVCITDGTLADATANKSTPEVQPFFIATGAMGMPDNVAYQPGRGNWIIHEDRDIRAGGPHDNSLWDCLPDGADDDILSDGCIRIANLNDLLGPDGTEGAEWTGGIFDASGTRFFVSVQHNMTLKGVVLEITGWK
jgi:secreted PhoX family phosphatase